MHSRPDGGTHGIKQCSGVVTCHGPVCSCGRLPEISVTPASESEETEETGVLTSTSEKSQFPSVSNGLDNSAELNISKLTTLDTTEVYCDSNCMTVSISVFCVILMVLVIALSVWKKRWVTCMLTN